MTPFLMDEVAQLRYRELLDEAEARCRTSEAAKWPVADRPFRRLPVPNQGRDVVRPPRQCLQTAPNDPDWCDQHDTIRDLTATGQVAAFAAAGTPICHRNASSFVVLLAALIRVDVAMGSATRGMEVVLAWHSLLARQTWLEGGRLAQNLDRRATRSNTWRLSMQYKIAI